MRKSVSKVLDYKVLNDKVLNHKNVLFWLVFLAVFPLVLEAQTNSQGAEIKKPEESKAQEAKPSLEPKKVLEDSSSQKKISQKSITVYSSRNEELLSPVLKLFEQSSKIKVTLHSAPAGMLMEKIKAQQAADVLITVDAGNLWAAEQASLLAPIKSEFLSRSVPAAYRDPRGHWWGVSLRLRTIFYNPTLTDVSSLSTYADLADPRWKGKLCLRTAKKVYNQSLVAMLIGEHGAEKTLQIVQGWVANLATNVFSSDTKLIEAVAAGQCAVGVANSYYYGRLLKKNPKIAAKIFWANQKTSGVHANISGAAVLKGAAHPQEAQQFVEFLLSAQAQKLFAGLNYEYPIDPKIPLDPILSSWGKFRRAQMPLIQAGKKQKQAIQLMDRAGYR